MIVNASNKLTLMFVATSEDQVQAESSLQPIMVKEDLNDSFSNGVPVQGIQKVDTFSISSVISVLLLLLLLVGAMWVMDVIMETGGFMVDCVNNAISYIFMFVVGHMFKIPIGKTDDTGQVGQYCPCSKCT